MLKRRLEPDPEEGGCLEDINGRRRENRGCTGVDDREYGGDPNKEYMGLLLSIRCLTPQAMKRRTGRSR